MGGDGGHEAELAEMPFLGLDSFSPYLLWRPVGRRVQAGGKEGKEETLLQVGLASNNLIGQWSLRSFPPELGSLECFPTNHPFSRMGQEGTGGPGDLRGWRGRGGGQGHGHLGSVPFRRLLTSNLTRCEEVSRLSWSYDVCHPEAQSSICAPTLGLKVSNLPPCVGSRTLAPACTGLCS